jgi:hypothetical protein
MRLGQILAEGANASSETRTEESSSSGDGEIVLTAASFRAVTYAPVVAACFESGYEDGDVDVLRTRLRLLKRLIAAAPEASRYLEARGVDVAELVRLIDEEESS